MTRMADLDRAHGLLVTLCEDAPAVSSATSALMQAFNLVVEVHSPTRIHLPTERGYAERLVTLEHLLDGLADSSTELSECLTLHDAADLVREVRAIRPAPGASR